MRKSLFIILLATSSYAATTFTVPYKSTDCNACKKAHPTGYFCNDSNKTGYCCPTGITNSPMC